MGFFICGLHCELVPYRKYTLSKAFFSVKFFSYKSCTKKSPTTQKQVYAIRLNTNYIQQTDTAKEILCLPLKPLKKSTAHAQ